MGIRFSKEFYRKTKNSIKKKKESQKPTGGKFFILDEPQD
jgi:hypothetical protein